MAEDRELSAIVAAQLARTNDYFAKLDGRAPMSAAQRRRLRGGARSVGRRIGGLAVTLAVLFAVTIGFGLAVGPIGIGGLFLVLALTVVALLFFGLMPTRERPLLDYKDEMPNKAVVQRLGQVLTRQRAALPPPAARQIDAINQQLPLLEARLEQVATLDPLAQDARRLMGKHLPELIHSYARVPESYRGERDAEGLTVDDRLTKSLGAAREALDDLGRKLAHGDLTAFQTQGRFIESRYKDGDAVQGG